MFYHSNRKETRKAPKTGMAQLSRAASLRAPSTRAGTLGLCSLTALRVGGFSYMALLLQLLSLGCQSPPTPPALCLLFSFLLAETAWAFSYPLLARAPTTAVVCFPRVHSFHWLENHASWEERPTQRMVTDRQPREHNTLDNLESKGWESRGDGWGRVGVGDREHESCRKFRATERGRINPQTGRQP